MSETPELIEYRVRPVTRYVVTRFEEVAGNGVSTVKSEHDNPTSAYDAATAMARAEREDLGWPPGDERMQFPQRAPEGELNTEDKRP